MELQDRYVGCLLGQALGDALGFVVEGFPREDCAEYVEEWLRPRRVPELRRGPFPFGQYSDDTQLARELMQSYIDRRSFDPADYARRIAAIFAEGRVVGRGRATEEAARRLAREIPWEQAGTPPPAAGNGTAMRAAPVGLFFCDAPGELARAAREQSHITHQDPRCAAGSAIVAGTVAHVARQGRLDLGALFGELLPLCGAFSEEFAGRLEQLPDWVGLPPENAFGIIATAGQEDADTHGQGISAFVVPSVLWSLYAFLRTPDDYWETVRTAIAAGGDTDTTAAMAGAMSGALNGAAVLPPEFTERLNDQGTWGRDDLARLARAAWAIKRHRL